MVLGVITQLGGSSYQWSLSVVGLAIGNPLQMGVMLAAAALLGWFVLGERVSWRGLTAIVLITASVLLLSLGAEAAHEALRAAQPAEALPVSPARESAAGVQSTGGEDTPKLELQPDGSVPAAGVGAVLVLLGVGAACFSGVAFAILTVGMRKTATENTAPEAIVFFINVMGIAFLGPWALARLGLDGVLATDPRDLAVMLATGACNLLAFLLVAKALQLTTVVRVNVINNALTTALTVAAGIAIFAEPSNRELVLGILLTLVGVVLISYTEAEEAGQTAAASLETQE
jgi:drug/metabolite transporter (DMT)-like permease